MSRASDRFSSRVALFSSLSFCLSLRLFSDAGAGEPLSPSDALAFLDLQTGGNMFSVTRYCGYYLTRGYVALWCLGLGFRVVALAVLSWVVKYH